MTASMKPRIAFLVIWSLAMAFIALAPPAHAQIACGPRAEVIKQLSEKYGETRRSLGLIGSNAVVEVYANADTGTWTIIQTNPQGLSCMMSAGEGWQAVKDARGEGA